MACVVECSARDSTATNTSDKKCIPQEGGVGPLPVTIADGSLWVAVVECSPG